MKNKKIWLAVILNIFVILAGCGGQKSEEVKPTTTSAKTVEKSTDKNEKVSDEKVNDIIGSNASENRTETQETESQTTEQSSDDSTETQTTGTPKTETQKTETQAAQSSGNRTNVQKTETKAATQSSVNPTDRQNTESQTTAQQSQNQTGSQSGGSSNTSGSPADDTWITVTGEVLASGIGKDTMMLFGKTYRRFSDGTYYCDNGDWARNQGPVAENLDEFYAILEEAVKTGNNNFTMHINVLDESFGRGVEDKFELVENKGTTYYARDRILATTIEMADFEKISKKTGKNVYWDLNYYYYVESECKYAPVEVSLFYTTEKMYIFTDREGFDKAVDTAYKDGVKSALFILKWDQKDEVFSWHEWSDTYAAGPYMVNYNKQYSYFYPDRIIAAEGPETGAFALSKQPAHETFVRYKSLNGIYNCMNELMDDGSIEKRDYSCCYMFEVEIVNWHDEIEKYQIPFCGNNEEMMEQVKKYTGERENDIGYVGYAKCSYEEAYDYYMNAKEYVPGNRIMYYMIADGYWILVKVC